MKLIKHTGWVYWFLHSACLFNVKLQSHSQYFERSAANMVKVEICWVANWIVKGSADSKVGSRMVPWETIGQSVQTCFAFAHMPKPSHNMLDKENHLCVMWVDSFVFLACNEAIHYTHWIFEIILSELSSHHLPMHSYINLNLKGNLLMII